MMGNALEWTSSKYSLYPNHPKVGIESGGKELFVIRGSSIGETQDYLKNKNWLITRRQAVTADTNSNLLGFRIVCEP